MRAFITALMFAIAACGGDEDTKISNDSVDPSTCDPVAQTGCGVGQKCTWINIDSANGMGKVGCVANGSEPKAGACQFGADGEGTGYDNCAAPGVCVGGRCEDICTAAPDSCASDGACTRYAGLFEGSSPELGACDFRCDPVTQQRSFDGAPACGSPDPGAPSLGCYGGVGTPFLCYGVPSSAQALTHGMEAFGPQSGTPYLNGCAPGYAPLLRSSADAIAPVICLAFCLPAETSASNIAGAAGVPGSGYTCADRGATAAGAECHFLWYFLDAPSSDWNGIGVCWEPANYVADWDGDTNTPDTGHPACVDQPDTDTDGDGTAEHYELGCAPYVP